MVRQPLAEMFSRRRRGGNSVETTMSDDGTATPARHQSPAPTERGDRRARAPSPRDPRTLPGRGRLDLPPYLSMHALPPMHRAAAAPAGRPRRSVPGREPAKDLILLIRRGCCRTTPLRLVPQELLVPREQVRQDEAMQR